MRSVPRRIKVLRDAKSAALVKADIRRRAGREEGTDAAGARSIQADLDQRSADATTLELRRNRDRIQLP